MKIEELPREQREQARACTTREEIMAFIRENEIELSAEQMEQLSGGVDTTPGDRKGRESNQDKCHGSADRCHHWACTGRTRPGSVFGDFWPDYLYKCTCCGKEEWRWI